MERLSIKEFNILLVEPSATQRRAICSLLQNVGVAKVESTDSVYDALTAMSEFAPDLVISSMYLEDGTGTELVQAMRKSRALEAIPFMLVSSELQEYNLEPVRQAGVIAILPKPFNQRDLATALESALDFVDPAELALSDTDVRHLRVLVVDDSAMARKHIKRVLQNLGFQKILSAVDGKQAVEALNEEEFDLLVTDYNMPNMNGEELLHYVRNNSRQTSLPIMMVTSERDNARLSSVRQSGVSAVCDKPFDAATVRKLLSTMLVE